MCECHQSNERRNLRLTVSDKLGPSPSVVSLARILLLLSLLFLFLLFLASSFSSFKFFDFPAASPYVPLFFIPFSHPSPHSGLSLVPPLPSVPPPPPCIFSISSSSFSFSSSPYNPSPPPPSFPPYREIITTNSDPLTLKFDAQTKAKTCQTADIQSFKLRTMGPCCSVCRHSYDEPCL